MNSPYPIIKINLDKKIEEPLNAEYPTVRRLKKSSTWKTVAMYALNLVHWVVMGDYDLPERKIYYIES